MYLLSTSSNSSLVTMKVVDNSVPTLKTWPERFELKKKPVRIDASLPCNGKSHTIQFRTEARAFFLPPYKQTTWSFESEWVLVVQWGRGGVWLACSVFIPTPPPNKTKNKTVETRVQCLGGGGQFPQWGQTPLYLLPDNKNQHHRQPASCCRCSCRHSLICYPPCKCNTSSVPLLYNCDAIIRPWRGWPKFKYSSGRKEGL